MGDWAAAAGLAPLRQRRIRAPRTTPAPAPTMSIWPVRGSMDDCCMATFISRTASCTSSTVTTSLSRMRASASARRMSDSSWRGVADTILRDMPMARISTYACDSALALSGSSAGKQVARANAT